jgi:predicted ester cyclase
VTVEENKALVRRMAEAQNSGDVEAVLAFWAPNAVNHAGLSNNAPVPPVLAPGLAGLRLVFESLKSAFPDRLWEVEDMIAEGDRVVCRMTVSGTHQSVPAVPVEGGPRLQRITPTGRHYEVQHIHIFRVEGGKIAEHWATRNDLGLLDQLGGLPPLQ